MIILIDAEQAFDEIQHLFMIKSLSKGEIEDNLLNLREGIYLIIRNS